MKTPYDVILKPVISGTEHGGRTGKEVHIQGCGRR